MKTRSMTTEEAQDGRSWFLVDGADQVVGRLASEIAKILRGKTNPMYTPHVNCGHHVVVVNAEKVVFKGTKEQKKKYEYHTGHPGGVVTRSAAQQRAHKAETLLTEAVWGMLPKGPLGRSMFGLLKVYVGPDHPHKAQQPAALSL